MAQTLWSIGDPSAEEQLYLEFINRARADPATEGSILAAETDPHSLGEYTDQPVSLSLMQDEFDALSAVPPLAFSAALNISSDGHSADMKAETFQGHIGSNGSSIQARVEAAGYTGWTTLKENVYSYADNPWHGHASFEVDWGSGGSGGMQRGRPHRVTIHQSNLREIGVGVVHGLAGNFGPSFVTQDFGVRPAYPSFVTGVVYFDLDGDEFYDMGEGIGGVDVQVPGSGYFATTSASGGYAIPLSDGTYTVTFTMDGTTHSQDVTVSGGASVKLDWTPAFAPVALDGPSVVAVGAGTDYALGEIDGALEYQVRAAVLEAAPEMEGAEDGTGAQSGAGAISVESTSSYDVLRESSSLLKSGDYAFHLAHSNTSSPAQRVVLERLFIPGPTAEMTFWSRLRLTDEGQWALVEASADEGETWERVRVQRGEFNSPEGSFTQKTIDLSAFAGRPVKIRFSYVQTAGFVAVGTGRSYGWFFDDIEFHDVAEIVSSTLSTVPKGEASFSYTPAAAGEVTLYARPMVWGGALPWSTGTVVSASANDFGGWATRMEGQAGLPAGALADPAGDYDGDGHVQAFEYALEAAGFDPASGVVDEAPTAVEDGNYFVFDYEVDTGKADTSVTVLASEDLVDWHAAGDPGAPAGLEDVLLGSGPGTIQQRRARVPAAGQGVYFRLHVTVTGG